MWKLLSPLIKLGSSYARNKLLSTKSSTIVVLALTAGVATGYLNETQVNLILSLLSGFTFWELSLYAVVILFICVLFWIIKQAMRLGNAIVDAKIKQIVGDK